MLHLIGIIVFGSVLGTSFALDHLKRQRKVRVPTPLVISGPKPVSDTATRESEVLSAAVPPAPCVVDARRAQANRQEAEINRNLVYSGTALALSTVGMLYVPVLGTLSLIPIALGTRSTLRYAYRCIRERKTTIVYLDVVAVFMGVGTGVYMLGALNQFLHHSSNKLLLKTRDQTQQRMSQVFSSKNQMVWVLHDGAEVLTPLEKIRVNDQVVLNTGELVPIDGVIVSGMATIDQHMLTGEAQPEEKTVGDRVFAATLLLAGRITVIVEQAGSNTIASNIAKVLDNTDNYIAELDTQGEITANNSVWPTVAGGGFAVLNRGTLFAGGAAVSCNFIEVIRLGQPLTILNYLRIASDQGILVKDGRSLEQMVLIDTVVFDKTGTLTQDQPHVERILPLAGYDENEVLRYAAAAEYRQTHPIARAVIEEAQQRQIELPEIDAAKYQIGFGLQVKLDGQDILVGSRRFMQSEGVVLNDLIPAIEADAHHNAHSLLYVAVNHQLCGLIELAPTVRPESAQVIAELKRRGMRVVILSGDHEEPVRRLATLLGADDYIAQALPADKAGIIEAMQRDGRRVCFIGDGINDSIALKKAAVSISVTGGSDIARESAQVVLLGSNLLQVVDLLDLSRELRRRQRTGTVTAIVPSLVSLGGVVVLGFGMWQIGVIYLATSIVSVGNAMLPLLSQREPGEHYRSSSTS
jgi:heavy metal translocating P-type ATPase